ncbi:hypothetical protein IMZ11_02550 [Microtetraspora sp. AC03309]|uniref:hypothetical protein n=1 Tax=Microtetraspora sp. AC03309 TaxID=2779376 RepID=UPI001E52E045|nr:hypothetical protein [Microtetraspora sp. AC03309]MCC5574519.1 hypothetical protein [Microtetraspora sp. AC03309]
MTLAEIAEQADRAVEQLATALNGQQPDDADMEQVAKHLHGIAHGLLCALTPLDQHAGEAIAEQARESVDALLAATDVLAALVDAAKEADYQRIQAAV